MPTRQPDSTHEAETRQPLPPDAPEGTIESPSRDQMQGANGPPQYSEDDANPSADQDIAPIWMSRARPKQWVPELLDQQTEVEHGKSRLKSRAT